MTELTKLYTAQETKKIDQIAIREQFNNDGYVLMARAGKSAFIKMQELFANVKKIVIFCGQGNNGGDGFVVGSLAVENNLDVSVVFIGNKNKLTQESARAFNAYKTLSNQKKCSFTDISEDTKDLDNVQLLVKFISDQTDLNFDEQHQLHLKNTVFIDALFGTGLSSAPLGVFKSAIGLINKQANIFSIDIPSGLQANTGINYDSCVKADATITFIGIKQGLLTKSGPDYCGKLYFDDLGIDKKILGKVDCSSISLDDNWALNTIKTKFSKREKNCHKHQFGHVLAIGGDVSMSGAITMSGISALRAGAGLVTLVTRSSHCTEITQHHPELMVVGFENSNQQQQEIILNLINKANVLIIGPGLGQSTWSHQVFDLVFDYVTTNQTNIKAVVIDADGLNILADKLKKDDCLLNQSILADKIVLTPHIGEAKKLLQNKNLIKPKQINNLNVDDLIERRFDAVKVLSGLYKATVVLKGVGSLVYDSKNELALCALGNPGMATAGMGDILTGIIAALCAQGLSPYQASCLAVYVHAKAGDIQANKYGERGLIATDILLEIRGLLNFI